MKEKVNKTNIIISVIFVVALLLLAVSATYAFFTRKVESNGEKTNITSMTGVLDIDFATSEYINNNNTYLIKDADIFESADKSTFTIKRTEDTTVDNIAYNLYLDIIELPDEFKNQYVKWALYESDNPNISMNPLSSGNLEKIGDLKKLQLNQTRIDLKEEDVHDYTLYLWLSYSATENQNAFLQKGLKVKVTAEAFTY